MPDSNSTAQPPAVKLCHCGRPTRKRGPLCQQCRYLKYKAYATEWANRKYREDPAFRDNRRQRAKEYADRQKQMPVRACEQSIKAWLARVLRGIRGASTRRVAGNGRRAVTVDTELLVALWEKQEGLCALAGIKMTTRLRSPYAASIDRIDSSGDYTPGNVQLVCVAMNYAKRDFSQEVMLQFVNDIRQAAVK